MSPINQQAPLRILLAVDSSEHTWAAVQLLCYLPLPPGSQVIAATMVAPRQKSDREGLSAVVSEVQLRLRDKVRTTTVCLSGPPAQALTEAARTHQVNLIVLGATGLRKVLGHLLDGIAQQVVEAADPPVLVVRSPCRGLRRVLMAVEGSLSNQAGVNYLARFPLPVGTQVRIVHVLPPRYASVSYPFAYPAVVEGLPPPVITQEAAEAMKEEIAYKEDQGRTVLAQTVKTLRFAGKQATSFLAYGDTVTEVMRYGQVQAVDMIVTGSRGLGKIEGWLRGSVSRHLIHSAHCSVLVVRDRTLLGKV